MTKRELHYDSYRIDLKPWFRHKPVWFLRLTLFFALPIVALYCMVKGFFDGIKDFFEAIKEGWSITCKIARQDKNNESYMDGK